jgi:leucyl aminopeptidase (aminopeptidase T)
MLNRTNNIAKRVSKGDEIKIESPNGTFLMLSKKNREVKMDTGIITAPGSFSNLPAGEVFFAPIEGTAKGKLVIEWAPTRKLYKPVTLIIEKGMVEEVEGKERYVDYLLRKISEKKENRNIAELGIGTNDKACRADNILESEKIFGTVHVALGDNSSFGGKVRTSFHQDFVLFKPTVTLIYKKGLKRNLMKEGKLLQSR